MFFGKSSVAVTEVKSRLVGETIYLISQPQDELNAFEATTYHNFVDKFVIDNQLHMPRSWLLREYYRRETNYLWWTKKHTDYRKQWESSYELPKEPDDITDADLRDVKQANIFLEYIRKITTRFMRVEKSEDFFKNHKLNPDQEYLAINHYVYYWRTFSERYDGEKYIATNYNFIGIDDVGQYEDFILSQNIDISEKQIKEVEKNLSEAINLYSGRYNGIFGV